MKYTKKDLSKRFSIESGIGREKAAEITNAFLFTFRSILSDMKTEDTLEIRDFGVFKIHYAKGRTNAWNPRTHEPHMVSARRRLRFTPSLTLKREFKKLI